MSAPRGRARRLEVVSVSGGATEAEIAAAAEALERHIDLEKTATAGSLWLRAGRAQGRRLGMLDYRDRFTTGDAWRLSARFPFGGREYAGLHGRGDAK